MRKFVESIRRLWAIPEAGILAPLVVCAVVFQSINPTFLGESSVSAILRAMAFVGMIAVGQTWLMISGGIDLSVGSVAGLCAITASWLMKAQGWPVPAGIAAGLAVGAAAGLINGVLSVRIGIPAFIATLGMLYVARGLNYLLCKGYPIYPIPDALKEFGRAEPLGLSWAFLLFAALVVLADLCLRRTVYGRMVYATGGNVEVAAIAGIPTTRVRIACYVFTGALAAAAGILLMCQLNVGQPEIGTGWELDVIASVVIGGVSLFGGVGTVVGTFLGLLLMQVVRSGLVVAGVNTHWQTVAVGVIMVVAVGVDLLRRRTKIS
ncbi:MAG: ABC transporter permease [Planctomycetes bacterium]|nr:ABC transporter permease [Planctomycetota bacterium]